MTGFAPSVSHFSKVPVLIAGLMVIILLTACSPASSRFDTVVDSLGPAYAESREPSPPVSVENRVELNEIPAWSLDPVWTKRFADNVDVAISPLGDRVVVSTRSRWSVDFRVYDSDGDTLWTKTYNNYHRAQASFLSDAGHVGAWVHRQDTSGQFYFYSPDGELLFGRAIRGSVTARMSDDASRVALVEHTQRTLTVFDVSGNVTATRIVNQGTGVRFVPGTSNILIEDNREIVVLDSSGEVINQYPLERDLRRAVAPSPDGSRTAVTTGQGENTISMFDAEGQKIWSHLLLPGGNNDIVWSLGGRMVLVYNVGRRGGVYMFDAGSGDVLWRASLDVDPDQQRVTWRQIAFSETRHLVGHLGIRESGSGVVSEDSILVTISIDGDFLTRHGLGSNLEMSLSRDGGLLAIADGVAGTGTYILNTVHFYDLRQLIEFRSEESDH